MNLRTAIASTIIAAGVLSAGTLVMTTSTSAQSYNDYQDFERTHGSNRRAFVMRPDVAHSNRGYRRYRDWQYEYFDDEPAYRRGAWRARRTYRWGDPYENDDPRGRRWSNEYQSDEPRSGGPRPYIAAKSPPLVTLRTNYEPGSLIIDQSARKLYYIVSPTKAYRYPISVGREGFSWTGSEKISRIAEWPDWHPPKEMRERDPKLPVKMTGGINNPLGAKAIYLGKTLYRIHGTNNPKSIGRAASSGCFRMLNSHVLHLAHMAEIGAQVHVLKRLPKTVAAID